MRSMLRLSLVALTLALIASNANAAVLDPVLVFTDEVGDHALWINVDRGATPPAFDLVGGYIGETDTTIDFVWEYADIPDGSGGFFEGNISYWEFSLDDNDGVADPVLYSLRARQTWPAGIGVHAHYDIPALPAARQGTGVGPGGGQLQGNCTTTGVISCDTIPGSIVTVDVDDIADTITAHVRRLDLRDKDESFIAVDGTVLVEYEIFQGIASCQGVVLISAANCDIADMDVDENGEYVLGSAR